MVGIQTQVTGKASLSTFCLVVVRVQVDPLKTTHSREENHQPGRVSVYKISHNLQGGQQLPKAAFSDSQVCLQPESASPFESVALSQRLRHASHSKNHQYGHLLGFTILRVETLMCSSAAKKQGSCGPLILYFLFFCSFPDEDDSSSIYETISL